MMPMFNIRMLMMFFIIAALLNILNFIFYASHETVYLPTKEVDDNTRTSKSQPKRSRFMISPLYWKRLNLSCSETSSTTYGTTQPIDETYAYTESIINFPSRKVASPELCPYIPPGLGPVPSSEAEITMAAKGNMYGSLQPGGVYKPQNCSARLSVAVIIPYRGPRKQLAPLLYFLHAFLMKQQLEYQVFVVEYGNKSVPFNRGQLFNIGFKEALKQRTEGWPCLVLHEAHLLPTDTRNLYRCNWYPRQMVNSIEWHKSSMELKFGGAVSINPEQYVAVNGFSNYVLEQGGDYDVFYQRLLAANYTVDRNDAVIGKYRSLKVLPEYTNNTTLPPNSDGLSTLAYTISEIQFLSLFTHINVTDCTPESPASAETREKVLSQPLPKTTTGNNK